MSPNINNTNDGTANSHEKGEKDEILNIEDNVNDVEMNDETGACQEGEVITLISITIAMTMMQQTQNPLNPCLIMIMSMLKKPPNIHRPIPPRKITLTRDLERQNQLHWQGKIVNGLLNWTNR